MNNLLKLLMTFLLSFQAWGFNFCNGDICCYRKGSDSPFMNAYNLRSPGKKTLRIDGKLAKLENFYRCVPAGDHFQHHLFYVFAGKSYSVFIKAIHCNNEFDNRMMSHYGVLLTDTHEHDLICRFNEIL